MLEGDDTVWAGDLESTIEWAGVTSRIVGVGAFGWLNELSVIIGEADSSSFSAGKSD